MARIEEEEDIIRPGLCGDALEGAAEGRQGCILVGQDDALFAQHAQLFELLEQFLRIGIGIAEIGRVAAIIGNADRDSEDLALLRIGRNAARSFAQGKLEIAGCAWRIACRDDRVDAIFFEHAFKAAVQRLARIVDILLFARRRAKDEIGVEIIRAQIDRNRLPAAPFKTIAFKIFAAVERIVFLAQRTGQRATKAERCRIGGDGFSVRCTCPIEAGRQLIAAGRSPAIAGHRDRILAIGRKGGEYLAVERQLTCRAVIIVTHRKIIRARNRQHRIEIARRAQVNTLATGSSKDITISVASGDCQVLAGGQRPIA